MQLKFCLFSSFFSWQCCAVLHWSRDRTKHTKICLVGEAVSLTLNSLSPVRLWRWRPVLSCSRSPDTPRAPPPSSRGPGAATPATPPAAQRAAAVSYSAACCPPSSCSAHRARRLPAHCRLQRKCFLVHELFCSSWNIFLLWKYFISFAWKREYTFTGREIWKVFGIANGWNQSRCKMAQITIYIMAIFWTLNVQNSIQ